MEYTFLDFLNSNFFVGITTVITGGVAYFLFLKQKGEERQKAARIIWIEILDCENLFDNLKSLGAINLAETRRLPHSNSWGEYKHLLAKKLKETDLKLIDKFFGVCDLVNKELDEAYSLPNFWREKGRIIAEKHLQYSEESSTIEEYKERKKRVGFFEADNYWWQPFDPPKSIMDRVKTLQHVTTTPTGERLRKIAKL